MRFASFATAAREFVRRWGPFLFVAILGGAMMTLSGCSLLPTRVEVVKQYPPATLLQDCPSVPAGSKTNGQLLRERNALRGSLKSCTDDKRALREWSKK